MSKVLLQKGSIHPTRFNGTVEVIEYLTIKKILVRFTVTGYTAYYRGDKIIEGNIKDPLHKSVCDIGFLGEGEFKTKNIAYNSWSGMLHRCYGNNSNPRNISYRGCTVHKDWFNFQTYAAWYHNNYLKGGCLDKDILIKGNKEYSSENCCIVPNRVNALLINSKGINHDLPVGVSYHKRDAVYVAKCFVGNKLQHLGSYKTAESAQLSYKVFKEALIKEVAKQFYDIGQINERVYNSLINYKVTEEFFNEGDY